MIQKKKPQDAIPLKDEFSYIYKGLPIISIKTEEGKYCKLFNGEQYTIQLIYEEKIGISLRQLNNDIKWKTMWITKEQLLSHFRPAYAITINKAQGDTYTIPHSIWKFEIMNRNAKYTSITRTTNSKNVSVYNYTASIFDMISCKTGKKAYIYKITDGIDVYIGSTNRTIEKRWEEHKQAMETENWRLYKQMRLKEFKIEVVLEFDYVSDSQMKKLEQHYIEGLQPSLNERNAFYYE